jgi:hypothetical protein
MSDLTGCKISKAYFEDCGIWPLPPIGNFIKSDHAANCKLLTYAVNVIIGGIGQNPQYSRYTSEMLCPVRLPRESSFHDI